MYLPDRRPGPIVEALCWSHARRKFFELADIAANARRGKNATPISPIALEAVKRIDAVFDIEREIVGLSAAERLRVRQERSAAVVKDLMGWMRAERARLSRHAEVAKAIDYMLKRRPAFTRFLDDGRICLTNNAAERALRGLALGRKSWLFAGSERGAERAAVMYTLIQTAKLNDVDPQAWLADVLAQIADTPQTRLAELAAQATGRSVNCLAKRVWGCHCYKTFWTVVGYLGRARTRVELRMLSTAVGLSILLVKIMPKTKNTRGIAKTPGVSNGSTRKLPHDENPAWLAHEPVGQDQQLQLSAAPPACHFWNRAGRILSGSATDWRNWMARRKRSGPMARRAMRSSASTSLCE